MLSLLSVRPVHPLSYRKVSVMVHRSPSAPPVPAAGRSAAEPGPPRRGGGILRGLVVLLVLGLWLAIAALGGQAQGRLSDVQENDATAFLPESAESTRAARAAEAFSETTVLPALVVVEAQPPGTVMSPGQLAAVQEFAASIPALPVAGTGETVGDLLTGPVVAIPAEDGAAVLVPVPLDADEVTQTTEEEERVLNGVVDALRQAADEAFAGTGLEAWVTGPAGAIADLVSAFGGIDGILLGVALLVVLVILVLVYRSPSLPFAVIFTSLFGLTAASLVVYELAAAGTIDLNGQSQGILFILVVGAATDYALLLVARYREELTRHPSVYVAMRRAWRASLPPISASAGTVIAGVLCLLLSDLSSNAGLGPVAAIGIAAAYLAALTFLPALLLIAGRRSRAVFWPRIPRPAPDGAPAAEAARTGLWERLADLVARRDRLVWVVTAVVLLGLTAFVPTLRASGTNDADVFLTEVESVTGEEVLAAHFDAGQVQPIVVVAPLADADAVVAAAGAVDGVTSASVQTAPGSAQPLVVDGTVLVNAVTAAGSDTQEAVEVVRDVREAVHEASPGALVGGAAAQRLDLQATSAADLRTIVPAVLAVILAVLVVLLRAVVGPVLILLANVLSFGASIGVSAIVFNHVLGFPGADPSVVLYAFVFLVALGIDYTIFLMTRVREESLVLGTRPGVRRGLAVTGGVITSAGVVLAATFGALAVIPLLFLAQISFIVAFGVLLDTLVVRSLLVPGLIHDIGRTTWWPWLRRIPPDAPEGAPGVASSTAAG
jgi:RND superfamily putative drug exporter